MHWGQGWLSFAEADTWDRGEPFTVLLHRRNHLDKLQANSNPVFHHQEDFFPLQGGVQEAAWVPRKFIEVQTHGVSNSSRHDAPCRDSAAGPDYTVRTTLVQPFMNPERVTQIIRFALAKAGREDFGYGDLGVIHLLKLLYLADFAFAQAHKGETFTGIDWYFHHFGPWNKDAWSHAIAVLDSPEIEPITRFAGGFEKKTFRFRDSQDGDEIFIQIDELLPKEVSRTVGAAVHEYGSDTKRLLHHVYTTPPMRATVPGARIDFMEFATEVGGIVPLPKIEAPNISKTQQKRIEDGKARLRESIAAKAAQKQKARVNPYPPLNEEEAGALEEITRILSEDEDQAPTELHGAMTFSPEFWQSDFRREHGLP